jgi:hypothetical protein
MVKKIFALASVSALTGLVSAVAVAGCSEKTDAPKAGNGDAMAPPKATQDGGPVQEGDGGGTSPTPDDESCMEKKAIDATKFPYAKAKKLANACTTKELDDLSGYFTDRARQQQDVTITEWAKTVSDGCAKCVFSESTGTEWSPIITKGDKLDNVNRGGCIEIASGKEACGSAYQRVAECRLAACSETCDTPDGFTECLANVEKIFTGPCKGAYTTLEKECGDDLSKYEAQCKGTAYTFEGPVKVQCIAGGVTQ